MKDSELPDDLSHSEGSSCVSKYALLGIGLLIHIAFFISACWTKWFNFFFSGSSLHICCRGMDFYQIPNGAYSYWHGGPFSVAYSTAKYWYSVGFPIVNATIYHPVFVLSIGSLLMLFPPAASFYAWMFIKLGVNLALMTYFFLSFRESKYIYLATFLSLVNSTQYLEIEISQFQFALNTMLLLMLIVLAKKDNSRLGGFFYFLSLLTKPIGLLWIPLFIFKRQWNVLLIGLSLFMIATGLFLFNHVGNYYINNLWKNFFTPIEEGPVQVITLNALLRYSTSLPASVLAAIKFICLTLVIILSSSKRISLQTGIFLAIAYYLLFYDLVYEYQYTTLIPILAICLVTCPEFQRLSSRICIVIVSLPNILFVLHLLAFWNFKLGSFHATTTMIINPVLGTDPTDLGWQLLVLSRIVPLMALAICVVQPFIVPIIKDMLTFLASVRKLHQECEVLGSN